MYQPPHTSLPPEVQPADSEMSLGESPYNEAARHRYYIRLAPPTITYTLIGLNLLVFILEIVWGIAQYNDWNGSQNINVLVDLGAKVNEFIALEGHYWRLFTAMFLHIGILHLLFNLYALYAVGSMVESYYGHWRYAIIYLLGGLFGSLGSFFFSDSISAGASGAIFAIVGAAAAYFYMYRENFGSRGRAVLQNILVVIIINLAFGFAGQGVSSQGVDNWGHVGGLIGGLILGFGLAPRYERDNYALLAPDTPQPLAVQARRSTEIGITALMIVLLAAGVYWRSAQMIEQYLPILGS